MNGEHDRTFREVPLHKYPSTDELGNLPTILPQPKSQSYTEVPRRNAVDVLELTSFDEDYVLYGDETYSIPCDADDLNNNDGLNNESMLAEEGNMDINENNSHPILQKTEHDVDPLKDIVVTIDALTQEVIYIKNDYLTSKGATEKDVARTFKKDFRMWLWKCNSDIKMKRSVASIGKAN